MQFSGDYSKFPWYAIRANYLKSIYEHGAIPFPLFHEQKTIDSIINIIDGLIITGGDFDIDPKLYGKSNTGSRNIKSERTTFEINIYKKFLKLNKAILGFCGGLQLINIASVNNQILSPRENKPIITIVQDTLLGIYKLTHSEIIRFPTNSKYYYGSNTNLYNVENEGDKNYKCVDSCLYTKHITSLYFLIFPWCSDRSFNRQTELLFLPDLRSRSFNRQTE